jgi:hypothetical protein
MLADIKSRQIAEKNGHSECPTTISSPAWDVRALTTEFTCLVGVDCMSGRTQDMKDVLVFESLIGKKQQLLLATQLVKMVLVRIARPLIWAAGNTSLTCFSLRRKLTTSLQERPSERPRRVGPGGRGDERIDGWHQTADALRVEVEGWMGGSLDQRTAPSCLPSRSPNLSASPANVLFAPRAHRPSLPSLPFPFKNQGGRHQH